MKMKTMTIRLYYLLREVVKIVHQLIAHSSLESASLSPFLYIFSCCLLLLSSRMRKQKLESSGFFFKETSTSLHYSSISISFSSQFCRKNSFMSRFKLLLKQSSMRNWKERRKLWWESEHKSRLFLIFIDWTKVEPSQVQWIERFFSIFSHFFSSSIVLHFLMENIIIIAFQPNNWETTKTTLKIRLQFFKEQPQ